MRHPASFRDPAGHLFEAEGVLYRRIEPAYASHYDTLLESGLYASLVAAGHLVDHDEVEAARLGEHGAYRIIRPRRLRPITYPYEWTLGQLRAAALLTLDIHSAAMDHGMGLKDASAYNVQFEGPRPMFVDTLSFERQEEGRPWSAYNQFCRHFVVPLELGRRFGPQILNSLRVHTDGIPVEWGSRLLGRRGWVGLSTVLHIHLHARSIKKHRRAVAPVDDQLRMGRRSLEGLLDSLRSAVGSDVVVPPGSGVWNDYEEQNAYSQASRASKLDIVDRVLGALRPAVVWDLGANRGQFAEVACRHARTVVALESDPETAEQLYQRTRSVSDGRITTVRIDLANPSPALGWAHRERESLTDRGPADTLMALALVHHLVFTHNLPLEEIAAWFSRIGRSAVVEFVPPDDAQVQFLARYKAHLLPRYSRSAFEEAFHQHFMTEAVHAIEDTGREIYVFRARDTGTTA